jgi:uncharacterized protein YwqG
MGEKMVRKEYVRKVGEGPVGLDVERGKSTISPSKVEKEPVRASQKNWPTHNGSPSL